MKNIIILITLFLSALTFSEAQNNKDREVSKFRSNDGEVSMIRSKEGVLLIYNSGKNSFTLNITCKDIKEIDTQDLIFLIDGKVLQITPVPIVMFYPDEKVLPEIDILTKHLNFEADYSRYVNGSKITIKEKKNKLPGGQTVLSWNYRMPKDLKDTASNTVRKQFFINSKLDDAVLMLSSVATAKDTDKKIQQFLLKAITSLKKYSENIDVEKLREELKTKK